MLGPTPIAAGRRRRSSGTRYQRTRDRLSLGDRIIRYQKLAIRTTRRYVDMIYRYIICDWYHCVHWYDFRFLGSQYQRSRPFEEVFITLLLTSPIALEPVCIFALGLSRQHSRRQQSFDCLQPDADPLLS